MATKAVSPLKAKPLRNPGQSLDEQLQELLDDKLIPAFWTAALLVMVAFLEWFATGETCRDLPLRGR